MTSNPRRDPAPQVSPEQGAVILPFPPPAPTQGDPDRDVYAPPHFRHMVHAHRQRARARREQTDTERNPR